MNILYLSYDGLTDPLGQSQVMPYIQGLAKLGHKFVVISFEKAEQYEKEGLGIKSWADKHNIIWLPKKYHKKPLVLSTLYDLLQMWRAVKRICSKESIHIIHCRSYLTALIGLHEKLNRNTKFIFDMRGFWADERVEGGIWNLKNPIYRIVYNYFKKKEKCFLLKADAIVTLTYEAKKILEEKYNLISQKLIVIPCCVDNNLFNNANISEESKLSLKKKLGIPIDDFVLIYVGSLGTWYMLDEMLNFFKTFLKTEPKTSFLFLTKESPELILKKASSSNIELSKIFVTESSRNQIPLYISIADCGILFIRPTFSKQASSPTKLAEILSMGIPVIANSLVGDIDYMFSRCDLGLLIKNLNGSQFSISVTELKNKKKSTQLRDYAEQNFSLSIGVELYDKIYLSFA